MYERGKIESFQVRMEEIIRKSEKNEAFELIIAELNDCEDEYLTEYMSPLNFLQYEPVLDWIERNAERTKNIKQAWGHLSASSNFSWQRAEKWLKMGRPWSLIALDALMFCTTKGERLNQSPWMRKLNPRLVDNPAPDEIAISLNNYLKMDSVPRTKRVVSRIINDIFEAQ